jgi:hypothetical protein
MNVDLELYLKMLTAEYYIGFIIIIVLLVSYILGKLLIKLIDQIATKYDDKFYENDYDEIDHSFVKDNNIV